MRWGIAVVLGIILTLAQPALPIVMAADTKCVVCILEVQATGPLGEPYQSLVILKNTSTTKQITKLEYDNSNGLPSLRKTIEVGSLAAGETKVYVGPDLMAQNPTAIAPVVPLTLSPFGGSLVVSSTTSSTKPYTISDQLSWGTGVPLEGSALPALLPGVSYARQQSVSGPQDTGDNRSDFVEHAQGCRGVAFSEIQPFVTDDYGATVRAWVELSGTQASADCFLVTPSERYTIPAVSLPQAQELATIEEAFDSRGEAKLLLLGELGGDVWLGDSSAYLGANGSPVLRTIGAVTHVPALRYGQTWSVFMEGWRATHTPTPLGANSFQLDQNPTACQNVRITEILPNPVGEDAGKEWIELHNESTDSASLASCSVSINGAAYSFRAGDYLLPDEWRATGDFVAPDGGVQSLSLRNSDASTISWQRLHDDGSATTLQTTIYENATEGQSWARFTDGWRWQAMPNPNLDNTIQPPEADIVAPEPAASDGTAVEPGATNDETVPNIRITELLPNPAAPATDDNDEFIELYNAGPETFQLKGYKLQAGNTYSYSYVVPELAINPGTFVVLTSAQTGLTLSNTSGRVRLVTATGVVVSETEAYGAAGEGDAWAFIDGAWKWTAMPSPGAENKFVPSLNSLTGNKKATSTGLSSAKTATPKAATGTTAVKSAKSTKASNNTTNAAQDAQPAAATIPPLHTAVLAVVGLLAVLYAGYEYRQDIANRIYQLRKYRANRRSNRPTAEGR